jgi:hypothetical protein
MVKKIIDRPLDGIFETYLAKGDWVRQRKYYRACIQRNHEFDNFFRESVLFAKSVIGRPLLAASVTCLYCA